MILNCLQFCSICSMSSYNLFQSYWFVHQSQNIVRISNRIEKKNFQVHIFISTQKQSLFFLVNEKLSCIKKLLKNEKKRQSERILWLFDHFYPTNDLLSNFSSSFFLLSFLWTNLRFNWNITIFSPFFLYDLWFHIV